MKGMFLYPKIRIVYPSSEHNENILYYKLKKGPNKEYLHKCWGGRGWTTSQTPHPSFFISLKWLWTDWAVSLVGKRRAVNGELVFLH